MPVVLPVGRSASTTGNKPFMHKLEAMTVSANIHIIIFSTSLWGSQNTLTIDRDLASLYDQSVSVNGWSIKSFSSELYYSTFWSELNLVTLTKCNRAISVPSEAY